MCVDNHPRLDPYTMANAVIIADTVERRYFGADG